MHDAVGILLAYGNQPAAEILFVEQVHGIADGMQGLDSLAVEVDQEQQADNDNAFGDVKRVFRRRQKQIEKDSCAAQQQGPDDEQPFYFHKPGDFLFRNRRKVFRIDMEFFQPAIK